MKLSRLALGLLALSTAMPAGAAAGYYRFPALHGETVVFTAEGDLWTVASAGGTARRLTSHPAEETRAAISPDGRQVAFSATYEGPTEVYVMPLAGGQPKRISFDNGRTLALGWTADGQVLMTAMDASGLSSQRVVVRVNPDTLERGVLPLADANDAVIDPSGRWVYFIRFGLSVTGDNARGYRGGALGQLWRYDLAGNAEAERIGPREENLRRPHWWNGRLVVISDRDGRDNLWSLAADGTDPRALTQRRDFDVRTASLDGDRAIYQAGADLRVVDLRSGEDRPLAIDLAGDFDPRRERWIDKPLRYLETARLSADGERLALTARGQVVLAGTGPLRRVDVDAAPGARLAGAIASRDGKWVYAISDASGEEEIWRFPADGSPGATALTKDGDTQRWGLYLSPDGKQLAHDDKRGRLWLLDLDSGSNRLIDDGGKDGNEGYDDVVWSADSRHLALVRLSDSRDRDRSRLALYTLATGKLAWLTSDKYASGSPAFSPDGRWLWFLSDRQFTLANGSPWGDRNTGPSFERRTRLYALALQAGNRFPFQAKDELAGKDGKTDEAGDAKDGKDTKGKDAKNTPRLPAIQTDGLAERLYEVPLPAGDYRALGATDKRLYVLDSEGPKTALKTAAIGNEDVKLETFANDIAEYALSGDGKRLYFRKPGQGRDEPGPLYIVEAGAKAPDDLGKATVRVGDWNLRIDPQAEWRQMFDDAWRLHRDHFFDARLRGVDWAAVRARYAPLAARLTDRGELDDLLGQMMGELGALHSQVGGGDLRQGAPVPEAAGLGARLERVADGWRIAHIYRTEAELPSERGPLQQPGIDVREGDLLVAINGRPTADVRDLSDLLRGQAGQQVLIEVRRGTAAPRRFVVVPANGMREANLRYNDWEQARRETVERVAGGRIGYLHLRAMGPADIATFVREFYAQYDRDGLIIDVRRNRGGNIDSWIIEKLLRRAWAFWARPDAPPYANMQQTFRGHLAVLTDELTYSDGETFSAAVKALKLGPLIGTRTAGAGVWLSDRNALVDRGRARVAEFPQYGVDGQWLVEAVGVDPDIVVENPPHATFAGEDRQLDRAIGYLQEKLRTEPVPPLVPRPIPPLPVRD